MKTYLILFLYILLFKSTPLLSQKTDSIIEADTTDLRSSTNEEILLEENEQNEDESDLLDIMENLKRNPYDLNKVTYSQLESLPFMNSVTAKKIIEYRSEHKYFNSKRALLQVDGVSGELYEKIKIYLIVKQSTRDILIDESGRVSAPKELSRKPDLQSRLRSRMLQDLQPREGFLNNKYEGSRVKLYNQLNAKYYKPGYRLEANMTFEKDPGEKNLTDFTSAYLELSEIRMLKKIIAGDYVLNFGQGLAMWSLQAFSKGIDAVNPVKKKGKGTKGFGSVNEVQFFRGGSALISVKNFNFNIFYSDNYYDASSNISSDDISSFYYDGYHRTTSEIQRKNAVKEKLTGGRAAFQKGSMTFGATFWTSRFSKPVLPDTLKKLFKFSGTKAEMIGADYDFIIKNMNFYGEMARSHTGSLAYINGIQFTFFKIADLIFSYRNYPEDFSPIHSFGFSERGETFNERGFYAGIKFRPVKGLIINSYFDQYKFPYRTYFNPVPTSGNDFLANAEWKAAKGLLLNLKYKNENKEESRTIMDVFDRSVKKIDNRNQLNIRAGFIYQASAGFRFRSRFEFVNVDYETFGGDNKGHLFYSDIRIIPVPGLVVDTRFIFFNTDSYDSRIYEFENDIQGVMSNLPLYGKGRRWYLLIKYKPISFVNLSAKYSETFLSGVKSIGSGNDRISGDVNNRLSLGFEAGF